MPILAPEVELKPGLLIDHSVKIKPGVYRLADTSAHGAAITVRGKGITVDFAGATLEGTAPSTDPDNRIGTGIRVEGENITLLRARVKGYKVGLHAQGSKSLHIRDSDFSDNYRQRLKSTWRREDEDDWQSYHSNENEDWLRYGAGVYLSACTDFEIKGIKVTRGQCGVMLSQCLSGLVWNCDLSYLSGIGVGLYRSSGNRVMHNKIDYCVRGYSHNIYNRGQDSAAILVFEQSKQNVFAYNSATHSGDGFFLWAGQTTMDSGRGGCNDNLVYGNDFSHAVTNGIEATFSRNTFANNLVQDCWHGVWGGYSYNSIFLGNWFKKNVEGMAIEHGQDNFIDSNVFNQDGIGIRLWANTSQPEDWGYAKKRNTESNNWSILNNVFLGNDQGLSFIRTSSAKTEGNLMTLVRVPMQIDGKPQELSKSDRLDHAKPGGLRAQLTIQDDMTLGDRAYSDQWKSSWVSGVDGSPPVGAPILRAKLLRIAPPPLKGGANPFRNRSDLEGRRFIHIGEWGPDDGQYPHVWRRFSKEPNTVLFDVTGPGASVKIVTAVGLKIPNETVLMGQPLKAILSPAYSGSLKLTLATKGRPTVDQNGISRGPESVVYFSYEDFHLGGVWKVRTFNFDKRTADPRTNYAEWLRLAEAVKPQEWPEIDWSGRFPDRSLARDDVGLVAQTTLNLPAGDYDLEVTSDDGVKVLLDDQPLVVNWTYHGPTVDKKVFHVNGSAHIMKVEYFQLDGWAQLGVRIQPHGT